MINLNAVILFLHAAVASAPARYAVVVQDCNQPDALAYASQLRDQLQSENLIVLSAAETASALQPSKGEAVAKATVLFKDAKKRFYAGAGFDAIRLARECLATLESADATVPGYSVLLIDGLAFHAFVARYIGLEQESRESIGRLAAASPRFLPSISDYPPSFQAFFIKEKKNVTSKTVTIPPRAPVSKPAEPCVSADSSSSDISIRLGTNVALVGGSPKRRVIQFKATDLDSVRTMRTLGPNGPVNAARSIASYNQQPSKFQLPAYLALAVGAVALATTGALALSQENARSRGLDASTAALWISGSVAIAGLGVGFGLYSLSRENSNGRAPSGSPVPSIKLSLSH